jgi:outer membrane immunogenic protein
MRVLIAACALAALMSPAVPARAGESTLAHASSQTWSSPAPPPSWMGFYVNESGDLAHSSGAAIPLKGLLGPDGIDAGRSSARMSGGAVGASWQSGDTVFGVQGDMQWDDRTAAAITDCSLGCSLNEYARVPWLATLRARAGRDFNGLFVYGTGGFSSFGAANNLNAGGFGSTPGIGSLSGGAIDWSIGGGMEMSIDKNVSARIEYLHNTPTSVSSSLFENDPRNDVVRGGVNYRLPVDPW